MVRGFTLAELLVAVAIMAAMMTLIGTVFSSASKASGKAQASAVLNRQLLAVTESLGGDLDAMYPGPVASGSGDSPALMGIARVDVLASEMPGDSPTPHRADVLMLLTRRPFDPYVYSGNEAFGVRRLVVYAHADVNGIPMEQSSANGLLASRWHLARRMIGFPKTNPVGTGAGNWPPTGLPFLTGLVDVVLDKVWDPAVINLVPPVGFYKYGVGTTQSPTPFYCFEDPSFVYRLENGLWYAREPSGDRHWYGFDGSQWSRTEANPVPPPPMLTHTQAGTPPGSIPSSISNLVQHWFYDTSAPVDQRRTRIVTAGGAVSSATLAGYFLLRCSEFKVEFTYDDPREIQIIPDWPASGDRTVEQVDLNGDGTSESVAPKPIRWQSVPVGQQWVWSGLSVDPNNRTDPDRWPRALRVTIKAYGQGGTADQTVTQTIVHAF